MAPSFVALSIALGVTAVRADPHPGSITGRVVDYGFPVAEYGVTVTDMPRFVGRPMPVESHDGRFLLEGIPPGRHRLLLAGWAFVSQIVEDVDVRAGGTTAIGDVKVEAGRHVDGRVLDAGGLPVEGATVMVFEGTRPDPTKKPLDLMTLRVQVRVATTNGDGNYVIDGLADDGKPARIVAIRGELTSPELELPKGPSSTVDLFARGAGSIDGSIAHLATGTVTAFALTNEASYSAAIDAEGHFHFDHLPAGDYDVSLAGEYLPALRVHVIEGEMADARLAIPTRRVDLIVTTPANDCNLVTLIGARQGETELDSLIGLELCRRGSATFGDLAPGRYQVCVDDATACQEIVVKASPRVRMVEVAIPPP